LLLFLKFAIATLLLMLLLLLLLLPPLLLLLLPPLHCSVSDASTVIAVCCFPVLPFPPFDCCFCFSLLLQSLTVDASCTTICHQ